MLYRSVLFLGLSLNLYGAPLTLEQYVGEVKQKHDGVRALKETSEAALLRADEATLMTAPTLFANAQWMDDKKPTSNPAIMGTETKYQGYQLGVAKQFDFGLTAKLSYQINYTQILQASPAFIPYPNFYEARPLLELSQSLLRNGFGRETGAMVDATRAQAKAESYMDSFKLKLNLAEAEMTYWGLAIARELVSVQAESLDRAKKIKEWSSRRTKLELADQADFLQAEAGFQGRSLEYQAALDELKAIERQFNRLRGIDSEEVKEELPTLDRAFIENLPVPEKKGEREDLKAAEEGKKAAEAAAGLGREKNLPNFDVYAQLALNGRSEVVKDSVNDSIGKQYPTLAFGLKFSTPLDFGQIIDDRAAYAKSLAAAELQYKRKLFETAQDWKDLNIRLVEAKNRLKLAVAIENAQEGKLKHERERLKKGRSVTYQVLLFEQDFSAAQAIRLRTESEILRTLAQMKTYKEEKL
mgnify:FL=1